MSRRTPTARRASRLQLEQLEPRRLLSAHAGVPSYLGQLDGLTPSFASRVAAYQQGPDAPVGFDNPALALGAPVLGGPNVPNNESIVSLGQGGFIVLGFSQPIADDPNNPLGVDFVVYGNAFYVGGDPSKIYAEPGYIEIAQDTDGDGAWQDETFYRIASIPATYTAGYTGPFAGLADTVPGVAGWSLLLPDDDSVPGVSILSAGGTAVDIAKALYGSDPPLKQVDFVRIVDALSDDASAITGGVTTEVDAVVVLRPISTRDLFYDADGFTYTAAGVGTIPIERNGTFQSAQALDLPGRTEAAVIGLVFDASDVDYYALGNLPAGTPLEAELFGGDALGGIGAVPAGLAGLDARLTLYRLSGDQLLAVASSDNALGVDPMISLNVPSAGQYYLAVQSGAGASGASASGVYELDVKLVQREITLPASLSFGSILNDGPGGVTGTAQVAIANDGNADLTVSALSLGGTDAAAFSLVSPPTLPRVIAPGATLNISVRFDPDASRAFGATLTVSSDDPDEPAVAVLLQGQGHDAPLRFADGAGTPLTELDAGTQYADGPGNLANEQTVVIRNASAAPVTVSSVTAVGGGFSIDPPISGTVLAPDGTLSAIVRFDPATPGAASGEVVVSSSQGTFRLPLMGTALDPVVSGLPAGFSALDLLPGPSANGVSGALQGGLAISADGRTVWFAAGTYGSQDVYALDLATGVVTDATAAAAPFGSVGAIVLDAAGGRLLVSDNVNYGSGDIYAVSLADGAVSKPGPDIVPFIDDLVLAPGGTLYASSAAGGDAGAVYAIDTSAWTAVVWATGLSYAGGLALAPDGALLVGTTSGDFASGSIYRLAMADDADGSGVIEVASGEGVLLATTANGMGIGDIAAADTGRIYASQFDGTLLELVPGQSGFTVFASTILSGVELAFRSGSGAGPNTGDFEPNHGVAGLADPAESVLLWSTQPQYFTAQKGAGALFAVTPSFAAQAAVSPQAVDFGVVYSDGPGNMARSVTVKLTNTGSDALAVAGAALGAGGDSAYALDASSLAAVVAPGESTEVTVTFDPTFRGPAASDVLRFQTGAGTVIVPLAGTGAGVVLDQEGFENTDLLTGANLPSVAGQVQGAVAFSADGSRLFFVSGAFGAQDVYALDLASGDVTDLTGADAPLGSVASIVHDAAGDRLLLSDNLSYGGGDVYALSLADGTLAKVMSGGVPFIDDLLLAPDGTLYAASSDWGEAGGVYIINTSDWSAAPWATGLSFAGGLALLPDGSVAVGTTATDFLTGGVYRLAPDLDTDGDGVIEVASGEGQLLGQVTGGGTADIAADDQGRIFVSQFSGAVWVIESGTAAPFLTTPLSALELAYRDGTGNGLPGTGSFLPYAGTVSRGIGADEDVLVIVGGVPWAASPYANAGAGMIHAVTPDSVPRIQADAEALDFGTVYADGPGGFSVHRTVTVSNTGSSTLHVSGITLRGDADVTVDLSHFSDTLEPGASTTFRIVFDPAGDGARSADLYLLSDDVRNPALLIAVTGQAETLALGRAGFGIADGLDAAASAAVSGTLQSGLVFSPDGATLYFAAGVFGAQDVYAMDVASGTVTDVTQETDPFGSISSMVFDAARNQLLVADNLQFGAGVVYAVPLGGAAVVRYGAFTVPFIDDILIGPDGALYAASAAGDGDGKVYRIDPVSLTPSVWAAGLSYASGLALAQDGAILCGTTAPDFAGGAVYRLAPSDDADRDGVIEVGAGEGERLFAVSGEGILDVAVDDVGFIYASQYSGSVLVWNGAELREILHTPLTAGELAFGGREGTRFVPYGGSAAGSATLAVCAPSPFMFGSVGAQGPGQIHLIRPETAAPGAASVVTPRLPLSVLDAHGVLVRISISEGALHVVRDAAGTGLLTAWAEGATGKATLEVRALNRSDIGRVEIGQIYAGPDSPLGGLRIDGRVTGEGVFVSGALKRADLAKAGASTVMVVDGSVRTVEFAQGGGAIIVADAIGRLSVKSGGLEGDVRVRGDLGTFEIRRGGFSGWLQAGGTVKRLTVQSGDLAAALDVTGADKRGVSIGAISVKGGDFTGRLSALGVGTISVGEGALSGAVMRVRGDIGKVSADAADGWLLNARNVKSVSIKGDVADSLLLAGPDVGPDGVLGTADDTAASGRFGAVTIKGVLRDSSIVAGVLPSAEAGGAAAYGDGDDLAVPGAAGRPGAISLGGAAVTQPDRYALLANVGPLRVKIGRAKFVITEANGNGNLVDLTGTGLRGGVI